MSETAQKTTQQKEIELACLEYLKEHPKGARWTDIIVHISNKKPNIPKDSIPPTLHTIFGSTGVYTKIARGLYALTEYYAKENNQAETTDSSQSISQTDIDQTSQERDFYESFAAWLRDDQEEVRVAEPIGGNIFRNKWGTPDVIGVYKKQPSDLIDFPVEIVSAEIKIDKSSAMVAFGQAVSYKIFSHKSYVVIPRNTDTDTVSRLDALCELFGIGLVDFDVDKNNPRYKRRIPAQISDPDPFYVNEMAERLKQSSLSVFNTLF